MARLVALAVVFSMVAAGCASPRETSEGSDAPQADPPKDSFIGTAPLLDARFEGILTRAGGAVEVAAMAWWPAERNSTALVLVHGGSGVKENYFHTLPERGVDPGGRLAEPGRAVFAIDLPGYGESGGVQTGQGLEIGSGVDDYAFVLDQISAALRSGEYYLDGAEPARFTQIVALGISMGGRIITVGQSTFESFDAIIPASIPHAGVRPEFLACLGPARPGCEDFQAPHNDFWMDNADPDVVNATIAGYEGPHGSNLVSMLAWEQPPKATSGSIDVPVLSILGAEDRITDTSDANNEPSYFHSSPDARVLVLEETGHMVLHHLNHVEVMDSIAEWLDEQQL